MQEMKERPTSKNNFFIYGSLRVGMYNFMNFGLKSENVLVSDVKIQNARLWSFGSYPGVTLDGKDDDYVVGEIHKYSNERDVQMIDRMEISAGYKRMKIIVTDEKGNSYDCVIYVKEKGTNEEVKHGDWVKYMKN